jgi:TonB family protein
VLWLVVDANGLPQNIKVQRALGMGLDEEAVKAVKRWRFQPATKDGEPVPVMINVEVNFRLYGKLSPHPDSASQPPRFPGVDLVRYLLIVRVNSDVHYSGPGTAQSANYKAAITDAGQERTVKISCLVSSPRCLSLDAGTYPACWNADTTTLEILGLTGQKEKWEKADYTIDSEDH